MNRYGVAKSPFGDLLLAEGESGLCWLSFVNNSEEVDSIVNNELPKGTYTHDPYWSQSIVDQWIEDPIALVYMGPIGTSFQIDVWNTLLKIPLGKTVSYSELAEMCGQPSAVRAVASAVASNPIAIFIPCHRVLPKSGETGNYRWGADKKQALLDWEAKFTPNPAAHR